MQVRIWIRLPTDQTSSKYQVLSKTDGVVSKLKAFRPKTNEQWIKELCLVCGKKKKKPLMTIRKVDLWHKKGVVGVLHQLLLLHSVPALDEVPKQVTL
jgi:hypothetical protein